MLRYNIEFICDTVDGEKIHWKKNLSERRFLEIRRSVFAFGLFIPNEYDSDNKKILPIHSGCVVAPNRIKQINVDVIGVKESAEKAE